MALLTYSNDQTGSTLMLLTHYCHDVGTKGWRRPVPEFSANVAAIKAQPAPTRVAPSVVG